ncbi:MAG: helix-turn-helix domain-containing protein [Pseudomonadota bacterium]
MPVSAPSGGEHRAGGSPANRSLERGVELLRAFRQGSESLGNGELAERTGLPKSTVSRLTQTLVGLGLLQNDVALRAYRLAPAVLSLAHAMRAGSRVLTVAGPLMRKLAERERINVGLAAPDRDEMIYLESIRYARRVAFRNVVSGQRVPMELTSLGRAYLWTLPAPKRRELEAVFERRRTRTWTTLRTEIDAALVSIDSSGFCAASWQPEIIAVAAPLITADMAYAVNVSVLTTDPFDRVVQQLAPKLLTLRDDIRIALERANEAVSR